jgi:hypothetical protein
VLGCPLGHPAPLRVSPAFRCFRLEKRRALRFKIDVARFGRAQLLIKPLDGLDHLRDEIGSISHDVAPIRQGAGKGAPYSEPSVISPPSVPWSHVADGHDGFERVGSTATSTENIFDVLMFSKPCAVPSVTRQIDFNESGCPGFKSFASTSSTSAKVYAPPLQLQFPSPKRNKAHECRCELILEMKACAMRMTIPVTACDVGTGIASGHLLGSMPEAAECIIESNQIASNF